MERCYCFFPTPPGIGTKVTGKEKPTNPEVTNGSEEVEDILPCKTEGMGLLGPRRNMGTSASDCVEGGRSLGITQDLHFPGCPCRRAGGQDHTLLSLDVRIFLDSDQST